MANFQRGLGAALGTFGRVLGGLQQQRRADEERKAEEEARRQEALQKQYTGFAQDAAGARTTPELDSAIAGINANFPDDPMLMGNVATTRKRTGRDYLAKVQERIAAGETIAEIAGGSPTAETGRELAGYSPEERDKEKLDLLNQQMQTAEAARVDIALGTIADAENANDAIARANLASTSKGSGSLTLNEEAVIRQAFDLKEAAEGGELPYDITDARNLANDYIAQTEEFRFRLDGMERIRTAKDVGTGASDLDIVFAYMKILDPISVVREGEADAVRTSGSLDDRTRGWFNNVMSGGNFSEAQRQDILNNAVRVFNVAKQTNDGVVQRFKEQARAFSIPENLIVIDWQGNASPSDEGTGGSETSSATAQPTRERNPVRGPNARDFSDDDLREINRITDPAVKAQKLRDLAETSAVDYARYAKLFPGGR